MIELKAKKCKGTGKAKGYGCGSMQLKRTYGLGYTCGCYQNWLLNSDEGKAKIERSRIQSKKKVENDKRKESREFKEKNKSIQKLIQEARIPFQKYIRMRDANDGCISCGTVHSKIYHAGHFKKAELYSGMIFDERNCFKQCNKCNVFLDGNEGEYRKNLIKKFGFDWIDRVDKDSDKFRKRKYTRDELIAIKVKYQAKLKTVNTIQ